MLTQDKLTPLGRKFCSMIEFDREEKLILEIRRHWFGLFMIYFTAILSVCVIFGMTLGFASSSSYGLVVDSSGVSGEGLRQVITMIGLILSIAIVIVAGIGVFLYTNSVVLVTTQKIAQMLYITIFHRKISQLHIAEVQDVTVRQKGILAHIFNYGTLVVETSGEQNNYIFTFTPKPYESAKQIVEAKEENAEIFGN